MDNTNIARLRARLHYYKEKKTKNYTKDKIAYNKELYHRKKEELTMLRETVKIQAEYIEELEKLTEEFGCSEDNTS